MSLVVAIQMDPIDAIDIKSDSTFVLALEAQARGHTLYHYLPQDLTLEKILLSLVHGHWLFGKLRGITILLETKNGLILA